MYIVNLSAKDENDDYQFLKVEVKTNDENIAIANAINHYYETYWTNTEWRKDEFEKELKDFKSKLKNLSSETLLKSIPNFDVIINEYEHELRRNLGATDKSLTDFTQLSIPLKIDYLIDIGCELSFFVYPKKSKFQNITL